MILVKSLRQSRINDLGRDLVVLPGGGRHLRKTEAACRKESRNDNLEGKGRAMVHVRLIPAYPLAGFCAHHQTLNILMRGKKLVTRFIKIESYDAPKGLTHFLLP